MSRAVVAVAAMVLAVASSSSSRAATPVAVPTQIRLQDGFSIPAPTGLEARLIKDAKDGRLDDVDLVSAALLASGVAERDVAAEAAKLRAAISPARAQAQTQSSAKKRGDRLLRALHATVLRQYVEDQSRVDRIVATNEFNCLSSAVLFAIAAEGLVDAPRGMLSTTHAFVRADVDGRPVDVETTTAGGFAVDRKKLVTREYLRQRGVGEGVSAEALLKDLQSPDEVSVVGLIAALYSNRAVHAMRRGDVEGAALGFDRSTLVASGALKTRVANWRGGLLNNAATGLIESGRAAEARALLLVGLDGSTGDTRASIQHNLATTMITLANGARAADRHAEALAWLDEAIASGGIDARTRPSVLALRAELEGHLAKGDASKCRATADHNARCLFVAAETLLAAGKVDQALDVVRQASAAATTKDTRGPVASLHYNVLVTALNPAAAAHDCVRVEAIVRELVEVNRRSPTPVAFDADRQIAACAVAVGNVALDAGRFDDAAAAYARAATFLKHAPELQHNSALVEIRQAEAHAQAGRCDEARPHVRRASEHAGVDAELATHGTKLLASCASRRANEAAREQRWAAAADELRRGLKDAPGNDKLRENLVIMVHNQAIGELKAKRCDEARALLPELVASNDDIVADIRQRCP